MNDPLTHDLADFGSRELKMASDLLGAMLDQSLPREMGDRVRVCLNRNSGYVFLSDEDYNVAMLNGDRLEMFHSCPECGAEGFADEIDWNGENGLCGECADMEPSDEEDWPETSRAFR